MGKGLYMAPELKNGGAATHASDAYAVGVILFRLLVGTWYTPSARLEDALAGLECYDWSACLKGLLAADPALRVSLEAAAAALVPVRRRSQILSRVRVHIALVAVVVAVGVGGIAWFGVSDRNDASGEVAPEQDSDDDDEVVVHVDLDPDIVKKPVKKRLGAIEKLEKYLDADELIPDKKREIALEWIARLLPDENDEVRDEALRVSISALSGFADEVFAVQTAVSIVRTYPDREFAQDFIEFCSEKMDVSSDDFTVEATEKWCADEFAKRVSSSSEEGSSDESE